MVKSRKILKVFCILVEVPLTVVYNLIFSIIFLCKQNAERFTIGKILTRVLKMEQIRYIVGKINGFKSQFQKSIRFMRKKDHESVFLSHD